MIVVPSLKVRLLGGGGPAMSLRTRAHFAGRGSRRRASRQPGRGRRYGSGRLALPIRRAGAKVVGR